jgi:hypothetical protein
MQGLQKVAQPSVRLAASSEIELINNQYHTASKQLMSSEPRA